MGSQSPNYGVVGGVEVVRQMPTRPTRVIFLAHGCQHSATDWWPKSKACPLCIGLPEEKKIVQAALKRNYMAVAMSSMDRQFSRCWRMAWPPPSAAINDDTTRVVSALRTLLMQQGVADLPLYALGASSGGAFVPVLAHHIPLSGIVVQIMAQRPDVFTTPLPNPNSGKQPPYPPTLFVHMSRDSRTAEGVEADIAVLHAQGTPAARILLRPAALEASFFSDRIEDVDEQGSAALYAGIAHYLLISIPTYVRTFQHFRLKRCSRQREN